MRHLLTALALAMVANAIIAFSVAFYLQIKVILKLQNLSRQTSAQSDAPWSERYNGRMAVFQQLFAGKLSPDLFRKWRKAILWVILSYLSLFAYLGILSLTDPAALHW